ncbi:MULTISPECIES: TraE/TraK family type IV conjugative transfer system protein [spotted fever group]|uniref:TraE/TraK family type IV conjugative transfer system protein n=1 Tax=spotted fever group TaxID=114277 RepID=UPI002D80CE93|nr:TraE/TraK family type IV conjugative transfer system protein [Rickettsia tamurae]
MTCVILAISTLISLIAVISKEERWVLVPALEPDRKMSISSQGYHQTYLSEWAIFVMRNLFTTSPMEVERQVADLRVVSSAMTELEQFFKEHIKYVQGSQISSVFFPKKIEIVDQGIRVTGTFRYWFGEDQKDVALEKSYLLQYKLGRRNLLLLTNVSEEKEPQSR